MKVTDIWIQVSHNLFVLLSQHKHLSDLWWVLFVNVALG